MTVLLAAPLDRFVAAVNAGDTAAFLACFAPDAVVDDRVAALQVMPQSGGGATGN